MLESLQIKNFRIFRDLRIPRLGRVNLLVGKNNSGKTCLLEALRVYGHKGNPPILHEMVRARNEDLDELSDEIPAELDIELRRVSSNPLRNLFHGYRFPSNLQEDIEIGPLGVETRLRIGLRAFRIVLDPENKSSQRVQLGIMNWEDLAGEAITIDSGTEIDLVAEFLQSEKTTNVFAWPLSHPGRRLRGAIAIRTHLGIDVRFVPVRYMNEKEIADLWDRVVVRPPLRQHVVEALRLIDPGIQEVVMLQSKKGEGPIPVLLYGDEKRLPLRGLGDGVLHLFHLILAAVSTKGGMVLFDEIENGLHWSVQPLVWKTLFDLATALDLQIFATTHSWDCVHAFKEVAMAHETEAMLFHLGRSVRKSQEGAIVVTPYDKDSLEQATRAGLEVR